MELASDELSCVASLVMRRPRVIVVQEMPPQPEHLISFEPEPERQELLANVTDIIQLEKERCKELLFADVSLCTICNGRG